MLMRMNLHPINLRVSEWKLLFVWRIEAQPLCGCYEICYRD